MLPSLSIWLHFLRMHSTTIALLTKLECLPLSVTSTLVLNLWARQGTYYQSGVLLVGSYPLTRVEVTASGKHSSLARKVILCVIMLSVNMSNVVAPTYEQLKIIM